MLKVENLSKRYGDVQVIRRVEMQTRKALEALYVRYVSQSPKQAV